MENDGHLRCCRIHQVNELESSFGLRIQPIEEDITHPKAGINETLHPSQLAWNLGVGRVWKRQGLFHPLGPQTERLLNLREGSN